MKAAVVGIISVLVLAFFGFAYFHSKSVDRAWLVHAKNSLLSAQLQLRETDAFHNTDGQIYIERRSNQVSIAGIVFKAELAAHISGYTNAGFMLITTNGVFIWVDKKSGPMIVGGAEYPHATPPRFRDF